MANLRFLLGLIPKTSELEAKSNTLVKEFTDFQQYQSSEELAQFLELEKEVTSPAFKETVTKIKGQKFFETNEFKQLQEYTQLKKSARFKIYFKLKNSAQLTDFDATGSSSELSHYQELEQYLATKEFVNLKSSADPKEFRNSPEGQKEQEFLTLQKSARIKNYFKFKNSENYKTFLEVQASKDLIKYDELEKAIASDEFRKVKEYMALPSKKKYELSEEFKKEFSYLTALKSDKHKWYLACLKKDKFTALKAWKLSFEEDFTSDKLDPKKWMTKYYWAEELLKEPYSLAHDKHFVTDGKNIEIKNSILTIHTKQESVTGKAWDPMLGFIPKEFNYTSGLISTGKSFRFKFGRIEAKIKLNHSGKVSHAFWMLGDKILPEIDIFKSVDGKLLLSNIWGNIAEKDGVHKLSKKLGASKLYSDFFIYTLDWSPEKLVWKINGLEVAAIAESVPQENLYFVLSSGIFGDNPNGSVPASMEIDWVKVYEKNS
jgi:beta-glucanase (GH16 family)